MTELEYMKQEDGFLGIKENYLTDVNQAKIVVVPFGMESSSKFNTGTRTGQRAIIRASHQLELFDEEYNSETYKDIGIASVAIGGGDILPALEAGTIDAAEWCCPKPDSVFGFQKVLKHYYLQGLHQVVVNADFYMNGTTYDSLTDHEKASLQVAADASLMLTLSDRIYENGKALRMLTEEAGVILHDTPTDYFSEYMAAALATLNKNAEENEFFNEVYTSMKEFADIAVPFWSGAQMSNAKLGMAHAATLK